MQPISTSASRTARDILDLVPPIMWFIRREMRTHRRGLSVPQFRTLCMVNSQPHVSLSAVAEHLEASLPTASRIVAILVKKGFLERRGCSDDRRQMELMLTLEGRSVLEQGWAAVQTRIEKRIEELDESRLRSIRESLSLFKDIFGSLGLPGAGGGDAPAKTQREPVTTEV